VQSFCHRQISDIVFRKEIDLPILTLEGNTNYTLDQQAMTKVEAFIDMLRRRKQ
jgi:benzoyl-CoA reductase/2-hydroxyglutaryl-CoA dehydratase subunit BcrC/BadD/HgdB